METRGEVGSIKVQIKMEIGDEILTRGGGGDREDRREIKE